MSTSVTCHCGEHFQVEESQSERRINCPRCNSVIFMTAPATEADDAEGYGLNIEPLEEEESAKPRGRKGSPDWLERYRNTKELVRGEHANTFALINKLAEVNATLDPLGATLFLAVSHSDAETSVAALAKVATAGHVRYSPVAKSLLIHVGPSDATGAEQLGQLLLETRDEEAGQLLVQTLQRIGPTSVVHVKTLLELLRTRQDEPTRGWISSCLGKIGRPARHAVEPLLKSIKGASPELKLQIVQALVAIGREPARLLPLLIQALHHSQPEFRLLGARSLQSLGDEAVAALPELTALAGRETEPEVKLAIAEAQAALHNAGQRIQARQETNAPPQFLEVQCSCGKRLRAKPEMAGKRAKCPACGVTRTLPPLPATVGAPLAGPGPEEKECSRCMATVPEAMVLCVYCGFDFRTGRSVRRSETAVAEKKPANS